MVSLLQTYGREGQATSYSWSFETTCPESPYPSQSVGTGQYCSAGTSVGSPEKWVPQRLQWPAETNDDRCLPAPKAIIEMVSCHCKTDCSSARCSCRTNHLSCTNLCRCGSECQNDEGTQNKHETDDDDDDDDF